MHRVTPTPRGAYIVVNRYNVTVSGAYTTRAAAQIEAARLDNPRAALPEPDERDLCPMTVTMSW